MFECLSSHPPGSVLAVLKLVEAGFSGMTWLREEAADDGSSGTVGKPEQKNGIVQVYIYKA